MAVGLSGTEHVVYVNDASNTSHETSKSKYLSRMGLVGGFIALVVLVGFAGTAVDEEASKNELLAKSSVNAGETLAETILSSAVHASPKKLMHILRTWRDNQIANLDSYGNNQMLRQTKSVATMLADNSALCASKDIILEKLNGLADQVLAELKNMNTTDTSKYKASNEAHKAWVDTESEYRLMEQKHKLAKEGAKYASEKYEKWAEAVKETETRHTKLVAEFEAAKISGTQEKALLQSLVDLLSKIKSLKAGADKSLEMKEVEAKINLLKQLADQTKQPKLAALAGSSQAHLTRLAESDEIANLLKGFIAEVDQHLASLSASLDSAAADLAAHKEKLAKYQEDVVDLSNAADKARDEAMVANLKRQNLAGVKVTEEEDYTAEHADYTLTMPPLQQEYLVLQTVISKVESVCTA